MTWPNGCSPTASLPGAARRPRAAGSAALCLVAEIVVAKGRALAAHLLQAEVSAVTFVGGRFTVGDGERGIGLLALAAAARDAANLPDGVSPGLDADAYNDCDVFTF